MNKQEQFIDDIKNNNVDNVQKLLQEDESLAHLKNEQGESAVLVAAYFHAHEVLQLLLSYEPTLHIFEAAAVGDLQALERLVENHPETVNNYSSDGWTPLHLSCFFGHVENVRLLLHKGASVNVRSENDMYNMPIHAAAASRNENIVQLLLDHGADPNVRQEGGFTPLHEAVIIRNKSMVKALIKAGADSEIKNDDGESPVDIAIKKGFEEIRLLL